MFFHQTKSIMMSRFCFSVFLSFFLACAHAQSLIPMVHLRAGSFYMGGLGLNENFDERPVHRVFISKDFWMGQTEVTNAQFELFRPEHRALRGKNGLSWDDDEAVVNVSYDDAVAFCAWLSEREGKTFRLPTEAEWEFACKAGSYWDYYTGDGLDASMCKNQTIVREMKAVSLRVAQSRPNAWGLYDMHGNVEEWCLDWYGPYIDCEQTDPVGYASGMARVTRGGSHNTPHKYLRSTNRLAMLPADKHEMTGFRVVQADFPSTLPLEQPHNEPYVCQQKFPWRQTTEPVFREPMPFVIPPADGSTPFFSHNHQPAVTWCDNGDILVIWFSADHENEREMTVLQSRLSPTDSVWQPASAFFRIADRNLTGSSLLNDGKGILHHINGMERAGDWQNLAMVHRTSTDNGLTWSCPRLIAPEHSVHHQVIQGPIVLRNGWLVQACDAGPGGADGSVLFVSKDGGLTWTDQSHGASLGEVTEGGHGAVIAGIHACVVELRDGSLMALGRNNNITDADGVPHMTMSISNDCGVSWVYHASPFPPIDGGQRAVLLRLNEGPIALFSFTDHPQRTPEERRGMLFTDKHGNTIHGYGLFAAVSYDEGRTWRVKRLISDGKYRFLNGGAWTRFFEMDDRHAEPRGYMAACQSPDNMIHLVSSRIYYNFNLKWLESD